MRWQRVESEDDGKLLFRFMPDRLLVEIVQRRYTKERGGYQPIEVVDLLRAYPPAVSGSILAVIRQHIPPRLAAGTAVLGTEGR